MTERMMPFWSKAKIWETLSGSGMSGLEEPYYDSAEWFYDSAPFIEVCQKNMNDLYELYGYPQTGEEVAWFINIDNWQV